MITAAEYLRIQTIKSMNAEARDRPVKPLLSAETEKYLMERFLEEKTENKTEFTTSFCQSKK